MASWPILFSPTHTSGHLIGQPLLTSVQTYQLSYATVKEEILDEEICHMMELEHKP